HLAAVGLDEKLAARGHRGGGGSGGGRGIREDGQSGHRRVPGARWSVRAGGLGRCGGAARDSPRRRPAASVGPGGVSGIATSVSGTVRRLTIKHLACGLEGWTLRA